MQRIYDENSEMQGDKRGDDRSIQWRKFISRTGIFFILLCLYHNGYSRKKSKQVCWRHKKQLMEILGLRKKEEVFIGNHAGL